MFKLAILVALAAVVFAEEPQFRIIRQRQEIDPSGSYNWAYETDHGIKANEEGTLTVINQSKTNEEAIRAEGSFSYTSPEGIPIHVEYVADENGFQPISDAIPKVPEYILRALEWQRTHPEK